MKPLPPVMHHNPGTPSHPPPLPPINEDQPPLWLGPPVPKAAIGSTGGVIISVAGAWWELDVRNYVPAWPSSAADAERSTSMRLSATGEETTTGEATDIGETTDTGDATVQF